MWYECLPSLGIIGGSMWLAGKGLRAVLRLENGGKDKRIVMDDFDDRLMLRDKLITGNIYTQKAS